MKTNLRSGRILTINGGSSSIRFAVYEVGDTLARQMVGKLDRVGLSGTNLSVNDHAEKRSRVYLPATAERKDPVSFLLHWLEAQPFFSSIAAVGHRVVHGMHHSQPERVTAGAPGLMAPFCCTACSGCGWPLAGSA